MTSPLANRRLLFFVNWLRNGAGMINREVAFARELAAKGAKVHLLSHFEPEMEVPGLPVEVLVHSSFKGRWYNHWLTRGLIDRRTRSVFERLRPDVIFTDLPVEAERALRLRPPGAAIVHTYHGTADGKNYDTATARALAEQRAFSHRMMAAADQAIVVSDYLLPEANEAGANAARVYNGVDLQHWQPGGRPATPPRVLFVGRYTECKGVFELVRAFATAVHDLPEPELHMHGFFERPEYEARLRAEIKASGLAHRIHMRGPLEWPEIPEAIRQCTVFANGSVDESFCMPFLEAQACGRACVGFHSRGIPEVVKHGETGWLAPPGDVPQFARLLRRLLVETAERHAFESAARAHAESFAYPRLTHELEHIVAGLLAQEVAA